MAIILRPDQERAVQSFFDFFASGQTKGKNPLIGMPTGYGKSLVIAEIIRRCLNWWPDSRIIVATHRKKLIQQDFKALMSVWSTAPAGIYSAGLKQRDTMHPVIFGGIKSLLNAKEMFGFRHFMIVDEAHLVSAEAERTYMKFIEYMRTINPYFIVLGLSATLYRVGTGPLEEGGLFTDVIFDCTSMDEFNRILDEGWLCRLIPKATTTELSVEGVGWSGQDYNQSDAQAAVDKPDITLKCVREVIEAKYADRRRSCLIFAQGVDHAEHITQCLRALGQNASCIHERVSDEEQIERLTSFENGTLPWLVNNDILTTGFDMPMLDMIAVMRLIGSPGLWVQILGRLTRPFYQPGMPQNTADERLAAIAMSFKPNGLVLDFGANTRRLGTINNPMRPKARKSSGKPGVAPIKICPLCGTYNHASATTCCNPACAAEFLRAQKINAGASTDELITRPTEKVFETYPVTQVIYGKIGKPNEPAVLRVSYFSGMNLIPFKENVCFEYTGTLYRDAMKWWLARSTQPCPTKVDDVLQAQTQLRRPQAIRVWTNTAYPQIVEHLW
jgi:DNA repair protein RadD